MIGFKLIFNKINLNKLLVVLLKGLLKEKLLLKKMRILMMKI